MRTNELLKRTRKVTEAGISLCYMHHVLAAVSDMLQSSEVHVPKYPDNKGLNYYAGTSDCKLDVGISITPQYEQYKPALFV